MGTWGYIEAIAELQAQVALTGKPLDRIYFACGSGGTAAGLALGVAWSGLGKAGTELVGLGVDDDPAFFYDKLDGLFKDANEMATSVAISRLLKADKLTKATKKIGV